LRVVKAGKFEERYENALVELLNQKRKGEPVRTAVKPRDTGNVVDLMDAMRKKHERCRQVGTAAGQKPQAQEGSIG
jgi:DNA end-binding protein Ku